MVLLESFWAYGTVLAALIGALVVPRHEGWRIALLLGALPALYVFVVRRAIPESPRLLLARGRTREAREAARSPASRRSAGRAGAGVAGRSCSRPRLARAR